MIILADVKKHFGLADGKYQQSKNKLEEERSIFPEKFETLKKETERLKAGKLMFFENLEIKFNFHSFRLFKIHSNLDFVEN